MEKYLKKEVGAKMEDRDQRPDVVRAAALTAAKTGTKEPFGLFL
jgi:hypothetical protein